MSDRTEERCRWCDGELEQARDQLAAFIAERTQSERTSSDG